MDNSGNAGSQKPPIKNAAVKMKKFLTRNVGPKVLKVWMVILVAAVIIASVGAYEILKPAEPLSTSQVSSVVGGSWTMSNETRGNSSDYPGGAFPDLNSFITANYTSGNRSAQLVILKFDSVGYADSEFTFLSAFSGANGTGTIDGGPYAYDSTPATTGFFPTPASSDIAVQHNDYVIVFVSSGFNFNLQQGKSLASDQVSDL
ncbi:MAG: hypothetical protein ACYCT2_04425 [Thermoplasmataceae archaeon]